MFENPKRNPAHRKSYGCDQGTELMTMTSKVEPDWKAKIKNGNLTDAQIQRQFIFAVRENHTANMETILHTRKNLVNRKDARFFTPLHYAVKYNQTDVIDLLIRHGADVNCSGSGGTRPLHLAAKTNQTKAAQRLLAARGIRTDVRDEKGQTPLLIAARRRSVDVVKLLVDAGADVNKRENDQVSVLHHPARLGCLELVKYLASKGADINFADSNGLTPLMICALEGWTEVFKFLLGVAQSRGLSVRNLLSQRDADGATCLHQTAQHNQVEILKLAMQYLDVNMPKYDGNTALHIACRLGHLEVVKALLENATPNVNAEDRMMYTPLHECAFANQVKIAELLLDHGADPNAPDRDFKSPIHMAAQKGLCELLRLFLDRGGDGNLKDVFFRTCLHEAIIHGHSDAVKVILEKCANDREGNIVNIQDNLDQTALHYAVINGDNDMLKLLLEKGGDIGLTNSEDKGPFHLACQLGQLVCVKTLFENSGETATRERDIGEYSALLIAAAEGQKDVFMYLCDNDVDITAKDEAGRTTLMFACQSGNIDIVQYLFDKDMNMHTNDITRNTALHFAAREDRAEVIDLLLKNGAVLSENTAHDTAFDIALKRGHWESAGIFVNEENIENTMSFIHHDGSSHMPVLCKTNEDLTNKVLDSCVQTTMSDALHPDFSMIYNFRYIDPGPNAPLDKGQRPNAMNSMICHKRENLLKNPVVALWVALKWKKYRFLYFIDLTFYVFFLAILTVFVIDAGPPKGNQVDNVTLCPIKTTGGTSQSRQTASSGLITYKIAITVFVFIRFFIEIIKLLSKRQYYFLDIQVYLFNGLYGTTIGFMWRPDHEPCIRDWIFGAFCVLLAWCLFLYILDQMPYLRIYVLMFHEVLISLLKAFIFFFIIIMGFSCSFYIMLRKNSPFSTFPSTLLKVIDMSIGELEYVSYFTSDANNGLFEVPAVIVFFVFCVLMNIAMINYLIGLAAGDIEGMRREASFLCLVVRIRYLWAIETKVPHFMQRWIYTPSFEHYPNRKGEHLEMYADSDLSIGSNANAEKLDSIHRIVKDMGPHVLKSSSNGQAVRL